MPTIDPALIPTIAPGDIFERLTTDTSLNVRWLQPLEPAFFEVLNRPTADVVVRQLIIAKALDAINLRLGHQALFPFLIPCKVIGGSSEMDLPQSWIWDMHVSIPAKWEYLRLAKIKRISGTNGTGSSGSTPNGKLRLIFTAQAEGSSVETSLFYADYQIDSVFTYQPQRIKVCTVLEETNAVDQGEAATIDGFLTFKTLDLDDAAVISFLDNLPPPIGGTEGSGGTYDHPTVYEIASTPPGGISVPDDFLAASLPHGTGILTFSAWNAIPPTDSDVTALLSALNYPFRLGATRNSIHGITIPEGIFREFDMVVPAFDEATGDVSMRNSPVWISAIERLDSLANSIKFYFSTYSIADSTPQVIEFATLTLGRTMVAGQVVNVIPIKDLLLAEGADQANFRQGFGSGHVVLSSLWGATDGLIETFFNSFLVLIDVPPRTTYAKNATLLSSFGLSRSSRYVPTKGEWEALRGSGARLSVPQNPSDSNRFVTESDQGVGDAVDFRTLPGFPDDLRENQDIEPVGYTGALGHKIVKLIVDSSGTHHQYDKDILPRLRCLLGRDPVFADGWFDGVLLKFYDGEAWISL